MYAFYCDLNNFDQSFFCLVLFANDLDSSLDKFDYATIISIALIHLTLCFY